MMLNSNPQHNSFKRLLEDNGFVNNGMNKSARGVGGLELKYNHPDYPTNCYVGSVETGGPIVFHVGKKNGNLLSRLQPSSYEIHQGGTGSLRFVWIGEDFKKLMDRI